MTDSFTLPVSAFSSKIKAVRSFGLSESLPRDCTRGEEGRRGGRRGREGRRGRTKGERGEEREDGGGGGQGRGGKGRTGLYKPLSISDYKQ